MADNTVKKWFEISDDELEHRMQLQARYHDEPVTKAVAVLTEALDTVMKSLGIDITKDNDHIRQQQDDLGITIWTEERPEMAGLQGFFVHIGYSEYIPYAWVGAARLSSDGKCYCDIHYFNDERLVEMGGFKVIQ